MDLGTDPDSAEKRRRTIDAARGPAADRDKTQRGATLPGRGGAAGRNLVTRAHMNRPSTTARPSIIGSQHLFQAQSSGVFDVLSPSTATRAQSGAQTGGTWLDRNRADTKTSDAIALNTPSDELVYIFSEILVVSDTWAARKDEFTILLQLILILTMGRTGKSNRFGKRKDPLRLKLRNFLATFMKTKTLPDSSYIARCFLSRVREVNSELKTAVGVCKGSTDNDMEYLCCRLRTETMPDGQVKYIAEPAPT